MCCSEKSHWPNFSLIFFPRNDTSRKPQVSLHGYLLKRLFSWSKWSHSGQRVPHNWHLVSICSYIIHISQTLWAMTKFGTCSNFPQWDFQQFEHNVQVGPEQALHSTGSWVYPSGHSNMFSHCVYSKSKKIKLGLDLLCYVGRMKHKWSSGTYLLQLLHNHSPHTCSPGSSAFLSLSYMWHTSTT